MQGHALVLQRPYTISDRINLVVAKEIQSMLNMKLVEMYVLVLYVWVFLLYIVIGSEIRLPDTKLQDCQNNCCPVNDLSNQFMLFYFILILDFTE